MRIHIENLKFQCIIGVLDFERTSPQDVILNLTLDYTYQDSYINYAEVVALLKNTMIEKKYLLIEDALIALVPLLRSRFPLIEKLFLKITKPSILADSQVSVSTSFPSDS
ncbi:MAG: dihydroneopterin aldolase [Sulfurimonadaceae bacterium]